MLDAVRRPIGDMEHEPIVEVATVATAQIPELVEEISREQSSAGACFQHVNRILPGRRVRAICKEHRRRRGGRGAVVVD